MFASNSSSNASRRPPGGVSASLLTLVWWAACRDVSERAATGLLGSVAGGAFVPLLAAVFLLFLVVLGLLALEMVRRRRSATRILLALPQRATAKREWLIGAAIGWSAVVLATLPLVIGRTLHVQVWLAPQSILAALISLATIAIASLSTEAVFRGYAFRSLESPLGTNRATVLLSAAYAGFASFSLGSVTALLVSFVFALLLTSAWRRTHALWLGWGLHFAWSAALGVLFGLPLFSGTELSNLVQAQAQGPTRWTGGGLGPVAAPWTVAVLLGCTLFLIWVTRDFAWAYTHRPIVAAGYPVTLAPPAAHAAVETAAAPPPLVQILPSTPQNASRSDP